MILAVDGAITAAALWLAVWLRYIELRGATYDTRSLLVNTALLVACRVFVNVLLRLHRWSFRLSGLPDGARVAMAGLFGTGLFTLAFLLSESLLRVDRVPRLALIIELLVTTMAMAAMRFSPRLAMMYHSDLRARQGATRTLIVGAGAAGEMLLRDLQRGDHEHNVVGFVDDNRHKRGYVVGGRSVLGAIEDLPQLAARYKVKRVLIAIPGLAAARVREILSYCSTLNLQFKILPYSYGYLDRQSASSMLQDLSPEDLLTRDEVSLGKSVVLTAIAGRVQLVTGAAGSIGGEVCAQLLARGANRLIMVDLDESGLYMLRRRFEKRFPNALVVAAVADIRDAARIESLLAHYRPHEVFHAAARKHVPLMEQAPCEAVKVNVLGTIVVAEAAERHGVERFIFMSTDKAVLPSSVMGATKRLSELWLRARASGAATRFCIVRFGNVLGSAGSVVPLFREQIRGGGPVTVTHPNMRRYFMTISEAVGLVLRAAYGDYGRLCVLDMGDLIPILDLARHMITMSGRVPEIDIPIAFTGLRPGEKLWEELLTSEESVVRRVDSKILVVTGPPPPVDLASRIEMLRQAAVVEDANATRQLLEDLVPDYRPLGERSLPDSHAGEASDTQVDIEAPVN